MAAGKIRETGTRQPSEPPAAPNSIITTEALEQIGVGDCGPVCFRNSTEELPMGQGQTDTRERKRNRLGWVLDGSEG